VSLEVAGLGNRYERSVARSAGLYEAMTQVCPVQAPYALALSFRIRFVMQLNAREAMHLIELRSGQQGHPAYRVVAQQMHRLIAERAGHRLMAEAMTFVDHDEHELERLESERRAETRRTVVPS
jgi:thymidylate synthase ThyX